MGRAVLEKFEFPDSEYINQTVQFTKSKRLNIMFHEGETALMPWLSFQDV